MRVKSLILLISVCAMCAGPVLAGQPSPETAVPDQPADQPQPEDCRNVGATLVKLGHFVDLWRDANLNDQAGRAKQYEMEMTDILRNDIRQCMEQMDRCKQQLCSESAQGNVSTVSSSDLHRSQVLSDLHDADSILKAKKRLLNGIVRSSAFSNKFRLFGDYMELLRRELDQSAVKVAVSDEEMSGDGDSPNR